MSTYLIIAWVSTCILFLKQYNVACRQSYERAPMQINLGHIYIYIYISKDQYVSVSLKET